MQATSASNSRPTIDYLNSEIPTLSRPPSKVRHYLNLFTYYGTLVWENTIIVLLSLQSLHALYSATKFIIDDYPALELLSQQGRLDSAEITYILTEAIGLMLATIINILFAIRLSKGQERVSRILELVAGTALVVWYQPLIELLKALNYSALLQTMKTIPLGQ